MIVTMRDGAIFKADTFNGIVAQMRDADWSSAPRKHEYMLDVAEHLRELAGRAPRIKTPAAFLYDLEQMGLCHIESLTPTQASTFSAFAKE